MTADEPVEAPSGVRVVGPIRFWRGHCSTPRPWPRLLYVERVGWCLLLQDVVVGIQWIGAKP